MVDCAMKWTSSSQEFGFLTPGDGGRDVFVRLVPGSGPHCVTRDHKEQPPGKALAAPEGRRDGSFEEHRLRTRVEVCTRYQRGQWAPGYEIAQVVGSGYRNRRPGSPEVLAEVFVKTDVRRAGDGR